jgi:hypothetical protein
VDAPSVMDAAKQEQSASELDSFSRHAELLEALGDLLPLVQDATALIQADLTIAQAARKAAKVG